MSKSEKDAKFRKHEDANKYGDIKVAFIGVLYQLILAICTMQNSTGEKEMTRV